MTLNADPPAANDPVASAPGGPRKAVTNGSPAVFQVVMAGMSARDQRLAKILMRHDPDHIRRFELAEPTSVVPPVILISNPFDPQGVKAIAAARSQPEIFAVVHAVPAQTNARARFTVELERLSLQLMPCLKTVVELAFEASPPGETLFPAAPESEAAELEPEADEAISPMGLGQRCDALVVDVNDQRANATLEAFAESALATRRCDPAAVMNAVTNRLTDLVVLTPDQTGFELALALNSHRAAQKASGGADVVMMMVLDHSGPIIYARAKLAGCRVVMTRPLEASALSNALRKPLRQLRDRRRASNPQATAGSAAGFSSPWLDTGTGH